MRILHFSLGLSSYRSGGLTRYSEDLMKEQIKQGNKVFLLYPSGINVFSSDMSIKLVSNGIGIKSYAIKNPILVPLYHGIRTPKDFYNEKGFHKEVFEKFIDMIKPDIFHIHTLMGLPLSLVKLMNYKNVKIVMTTHDYFGICLKVNLININNKLCLAPNAENCARCNFNATSKIFIRFRNEPFVILLKNILKYSLLNRSDKTTRKKSSFFNDPDVDLNINGYQYLLNYYKRIFSLIDVFHFNSSSTEQIYRSFISIKKGVVVPITHGGIKDSRKLKDFSGNILKIGFIGSTDPFKGFFLLKRVLMNLYSRGLHNWSLSVWGGLKGIDAECNNIVYKGRYSERQLLRVYSSMDLLVVPSIWKETFSLITLEALSFGVPVIVSNNVGAKDVVMQYDSSFVYTSESELMDLLHSILLSKSKLSNFNEKILKMAWCYNIEQHVRDIMNLIYL